MSEMKEKREKKARAKLMILATPPPELPMDSILSMEVHGERIVIPWELRMAIPQMTPQEREKARRAYRREYMKKPETIAKVRERMSKPEVIAKRKEYAERPEVKARKKELAARARAIKRALKELQPDNYESLRKKVEEEMRHAQMWDENVSHEQSFDGSNPSSEHHSD